MSKKYFVNMSDVTPYSPANHHGTNNYRVISKETVGAKHLEVLVGVIEKGQGALPHAHPGMEQVCYILEGEAMAEVGGQKKIMKAGDFVFFPEDEMHVFTALSEEPIKIIVIYSPPYNEDSSKVRK